MKKKESQLSLDVETPESKLLKEATHEARIYADLEYHSNFIGSVSWPDRVSLRMYFALGADKKRTNPVFVEVEFRSQGNSPDKYFHPGTNFIDQAPSLWLRIQEIDRKEFFLMFDGVGITCTYDISFDDDIPATLDPFSTEWFDVYGYMRAMHCLILERITYAKFVEDRENIPLDQQLLLAAEKRLNSRILRFFQKVGEVLQKKDKAPETAATPPPSSDVVDPSQKSTSAS